MVVLMLFLALLLLNVGGGDDDGVDAVLVIVVAFSSGIRFIYIKLSDVVGGDVGAVEVGIYTAAAGGGGDCVGFFCCGVGADGVSG